MLLPNRVRTYLWRFALAAIFLAWPSSVAASKTADPFAKMVWVHDEPQGLKLDARDPDSFFGAFYPLAIGAAQRDLAKIEVQQAIEAGVDGFDVDVFLEPNRIMPLYLGAADHAARRFWLAPTLDASVEEGRGTRPSEIATLVVSAVRRYVKEIAPGHESAFRVGPRYVVFVYGLDDFPAEFWGDIRHRLDSQGISVFWVGDLTLRHAPPQRDRQAAIGRYLSTVDAAFSFRSLASEYEQLASQVAQTHRSFGGGLWPGYYRGVRGREAISPYGEDASGTVMLRRLLGAQIQGQSDWVHISTWNDYVEHTAVAPSSDWTETRSDLVRWYSDSFKQTRNQDKTPITAVTTTQALYANETGLAEGLVLNYSASAIEARLEWVASSGKVTLSEEWTVPPHEIGSRQVVVDDKILPPGEFLRVRLVWSNAVSKNQVLSAPMIRYSASRPEELRAPHLYYSIDSASGGIGGCHLVRAAPGQVTVSLDGAARPKLVELLHDTKAVAKVMSRKSAILPLGSDVWFDNRGDPRDHGYYVARCVDATGHVSYSDPLLLRPAR